MTPPEILDALTGILRDILENPTLTLSEATTAEDVEGWDSVNHVLLVVEVERRFGIKFKTAEIEMLTNVGDLIRLVSKKTAGTR